MPLYGKRRLARRQRRKTISNNITYETFDQKGNIVAKNPHGEEMLSKLEELMPEKK